MKKTVLGTDREKRKDLGTSTMVACQILNNFVIPIARDLSYKIDIQDKSLLAWYLKNPARLREDYIGEMVKQANNPALGKVLRDSAEKLWNDARKKYNYNPIAAEPIVKDVMDYIAITGEDVQSFHARPNNPAIEEACKVYATEEDMEKREAIEALCDHLNEVFNGCGGFFSAYIGLVQGRFYPIREVTNYKPLINGESEE